MGHCKCERCGARVRKVYKLEYFYLGVLNSGFYCDLCTQTLTLYLSKTQSNEKINNKLSTC